jgi:hypothetical protein
VILEQNHIAKQLFPGEIQKMWYIFGGRRNVAPTVLIGRFITLTINTQNRPLCCLESLNLKITVGDGFPVSVILEQNHIAKQLFPPEIPKM